VRQTQREYLNQKKKKTHTQSGTIVSADEGVAVFFFQLTVDVFLCLFHSNIHISIQAGENA
jgi:hypothetical protein